MVGLSEYDEMPNQKLYSLGYFDGIDFIGFRECKEGEKGVCNNKLEFRQYDNETTEWKVEVVNLDSLAVFD